MLKANEANAIVWAHNRRLAVVLGISSVVLVVAGAWLLLEKRRACDMSFGSACLTVERVTTPESQRQGLSGRKSLDKDTGMLFVFERADKPCLWMKDMYFAIDMVWIGNDKRVTKIAPNVAPDTYPQTFCADAPSLYVLETPAGAAAQAGVAVGDRLQF